MRGDASRAWPHNGKVITQQLSDSVIAMMEFNVEAMSCGHCVRAVTEAVHAVDAQAKVDVDLATHKVKVESTSPAAALVASLAKAGYPASEV